MMPLPLCRYRLVFRALESGMLPAFSGSALRGVFGAQFKRTVCVTKFHDCGDCPLVATCVFPRIFEGRSAAGSGILRNLDRVPVPYVIESEFGKVRRFAAGDEVSVFLTLIGNANRGLPYVVRAWSEAGRRGIGPGRISLELVAIERQFDLAGSVTEAVMKEDQIVTVPKDQSPKLPELGHGIFSIELTSPLRLRLEGDLVTPDRISGYHLAVAAMRRISSLASVYGSSSSDHDFSALKDCSGALSVIDPKLGWVDYTRYSSRQKQLMKTGGIVGSLMLSVPPEAVAVMPWLWLGQWVGIGKNTSMGLGQYRLSP